jgi:multiple sugar transport system substrate-binding protein
MPGTVRSRRSFLRGALVGLSAAATLPILAACAPAPAPTSTPAPAGAPSAGAKPPAEAPKPADKPAAAAPTTAPAAPATAAGGAQSAGAKPAAEASKPAEKPAAAPAKAGAAKVSLLHWDPPLAKDSMVVFDPLIKRYREKGNNTDVAVEIVPWNGRIERKMSAYAAGTSPDVSYLNVDEFTTYADQNALVELDKYVTQADRDDMYTACRNAMEWKGKLYEMPVLYPVAHPWINVDVWEKSGLDPSKPPATWSELDEALKKLKAGKEGGKHSAWPLAIAGLGTSPSLFNHWFYQAGGSLLTQDGKSGYDSPAGIEAMKWITYLFDNFTGPSDKASTGADFQDRFFQGQLAVLSWGDARVAQRWQREAPQMKIDVPPVLTNKRQWAHGSVGAYGIWGPSKQKDEAWRWVDFLTRDGNLEYNQGFGFIPPRISVQAEYLKTAHPIVKKSIDLTFKAADIEKHPRLWDMWAILDPGVQGALTKKQPPEEAARSIAAKVNKDVLKIG